MPAHIKQGVSLPPSTIAISEPSIPQLAPNQLVPKGKDFDESTHLHVSSLLQVRTVDVHPSCDNTKRLVVEFRVPSLPCFVQFGRVSHQATRDRRLGKGCLCWRTSCLALATATTAATHTCSSTSRTCRPMNPFASPKLHRQEVFVPTSVQSIAF